MHACEIIIILVTSILRNTKMELIATDATAGSLHAHVVSNFLMFPACRTKTLHNQGKSVEYSEI
jgi:hypothetical protein